MNLMNKQFDFYKYRDKKYKDKYEKLKQINSIDFSHFNIKHSKRQIDKISKLTDKELHKLTGETLISFISNHSIYRTINIENNKITLKSKGDFDNLLKFLKSNILYDEYGKIYYEVSGQKKEINMNI
jgi:hypothetical protein